MWRSNRRTWQASVTNHRGDELRVQMCSVELTSNGTLFVDRLVDMNRCIGLTRSKLLYPLGHEAISPASLGFHYGSSNTYSVYFLFHDNLCFAASWPFPYSRRLKNAEKKWGRTPRAQEQWSIITGIVGSKTETHELLMIQIRFVPDTWWCPG